MDSTLFLFVTAGAALSVAAYCLLSSFKNARPNDSIDLRLKSHSLHLKDLEGKIEAFQLGFQAILKRIKELETDVEIHQGTLRTLLSEGKKTSKKNKRAKS